MPLVSTGAFMAVLDAVAVAEEPVRIDPRAIRWEGEGNDRRAVVDNVEHWLWKAAVSGQTFAELGVPWAHPTMTGLSFGPILQGSRSHITATDEAPFLLRVPVLSCTP